MVVLSVAPAVNAETSEPVSADMDTALPAASAAAVDLIQLSIFGHRFMSIAEQMGRALQRTAISTNIKV
jgi:5-oxoprolinase (ATP-hydrolysing)